MRGTILVSLALLAGGAFLGFAPQGAKATTVKVKLKQCSITAPANWCNDGSSFTSGGITFAGWEANFSSGSLGSADIVYKKESGKETGLGVLCTYGTGDKCSEHEINTSPPQYISMDISGIKFSELWIGIGSNDLGGGGAPETTYIYGGSCDNVLGCLGSIEPLGYNTGGAYPNNGGTFKFTASDLNGYDFLYFTPLGPGSGDAYDANVLLASVKYTTVPEPAALGMFGLGLLLIGGFVGLRRRAFQS